MGQETCEYRIAHVFLHMWNTAVSGSYLSISPRVPVCPMTARFLLMRLKRSCFSRDHPEHILGEFSGRFRYGQESLSAFRSPAKDLLVLLTTTPKNKFLAVCTANNRLLFRFLDLFPTPETRITVLFWWVSLWRPEDQRLSLSSRVFLGVGYFTAPFEHQRKKIR